MAPRFARHDQAGMTLIEILIVVVILGILAAVAIFGVGVFRDDATARACATDRRQVETAAAAYVTEHKATPPESAPGADPGLVAAGFLRSYPAGSGYTIDYDRDTDGAFTVRGVTPTSDEADNTPFAGCA